MYTTGMKRENYYEGTVMDIRKIFVGFGHYLERLGIKDEGEISDYENYLNERDKQLEQERQDEHLELICWICNNKSNDFPFMIIKGEEWNRFRYSDIEDDEMEMVLVNGEEFYNKFKDITSIDLMNLTDSFVSMSYIDEGNNDIEIVLNIDGNMKKYIIGV